MFSLPFTNTLLQLLIFVGCVYLVGYLVYLCNRLFYGTLGNSRTVCLATGIIGTPIHELSHAVFCLVFFHRITDMKLYQIDDESGTLGYVNHSYNPKNWYQQIGNYFIGVAPLFGGSIFLYFLMTYLVPDAYVLMSAVLTEVPSMFNGKFGLELVPTLFKTVFAAVETIFFTNFNFKTVIFIIVAFCIALHMNLSGADIKGSVKPLPLLALVLFLVNFILNLVSKSAYNGFLEAVFELGCYLLVFLVLSLILSVIILAFGLGFRFVKKR